MGNGCTMYMERSTAMNELDSCDSGQRPDVCLLDESTQALNWTWTASNHVEGGTIS